MNKLRHCQPKYNIIELLYKEYLTVT